MDMILSTFYYDTMHRYLRHSEEYQAARQALTASKDKTFPSIEDAALHLAEYQGYLSFCQGLHLGMALVQELTPLWDAEF